MTASITFRIANWKLALLALAFIILFFSLGCWQIQRAQQKKLLIKAFADRTLHTPLTAAQLDPKQDLRYFRAEVTGSFDNNHSVLLDNKIVDGRVGYEVYTPLLSTELNIPILIDRGFIPLGANRRDIPPIRPVTGMVKLTGMLNLPPSYFSLGSMYADTQRNWPQRVEYIDLDKLWGKNAFFPYILMLDPKDPAAYAMQWQAIVTMPPERHIGYAVQWFALALTLLILFYVLNRKSLNEVRS